jgi:hypothetical protein
MHRQAGENGRIYSFIFKYNTMINPEPELFNTGRSYSARG